MLLAASLRRHLRCEHELVAAIPVPEHRWGRPSTRTLGFMKSIGVRVVAITNGFDTEYPIGNKISCLGIPTDADVRVFLDSDIVCLQSFSGFAPADCGEMEPRFRVVPADTDTSAPSEASWAHIYAMQNLAPPAERMCAAVSGAPMLPYFNAGFIAVDSRIDFAATWLRICREIDADERVVNKRPWLDQIALPVAARSLGIGYTLLDKRFNYPAHLAPVGSDPLPYFVHYHNQKVLFANAMLREFARELAAEHPELDESIAADRKWRRLTRLQRLTRWWVSLS